MIQDITIISGGQSGVDRAALDFAIKFGISCKGCCPKGRLAEDGPIDSKYPLQELDSRAYSDRTHKNVEEADALLVLYAREMDAGTELALHTALELNKPLVSLDLSDDIVDHKTVLNAWLENQKPKSLNIAGPRESNNPGIHMLSLKFLQKSLI